ncbi:hypothetical protein FB45DRAFT_940726 [Roridomyces roridus]|uniref:Uncharacterized protein n=1 Tax=Roridomyces roridus TaxID=1738132 RepID=A0AAD7FC87_9AGAR|nr:hypothetical protein FB45DRAFT_940726 [Roridomyces roridus]
MASPLAAMRQFSGGKRVDDILSRFEKLGSKVRPMVEVSEESDKDVPEDSDSDKIRELLDLMSQAEDWQREAKGQKGHLKLRGQAGCLDQVTTMLACLEEALHRTLQPKPTKDTLDSESDQDSESTVVPLSPFAQSQSNTSSRQIFDVVFMPFPVYYSMQHGKKKTRVQLPDSALCHLQRALDTLGLFFQMAVPSDLSKKQLKEFFDLEVARFFDDRQYHRNGHSRVDWVFVERLNSAGGLKEVVVEPGKYEIDYIAKRLTKNMPNYLEEDSGNKLLMIAPPISHSTTEEQLSGSIKLPGHDTLLLGHRCHVSRAVRAIHDNGELGDCHWSCPSRT